MLNESLAPRDILSEGLKHHLDAKKPLTEHLYRAGSTNYFNLWAEARSMYSRGILEITHEDDLAVLTETNLGHYGMFEGKKVPLDFPIELNESYDYDEVAQSEFGMDYDQLGDSEKEWVRDEIDNMSINEANSNYPDFDLDKNVRYQDTVITSGMWRYTDKESGGKGIYRNLMNDQFLGFSSEDLGYFKKHLGSHFDMSESLSEAKKKTKKNTKKLNKPTRDSSGGKAYKVYVKDPKTGKIKTVRFGSGGLRAKINDKKARNAFAARHKCSTKKDKTKAGYWSCRLPRYAKLLGLKSNFSGFW
ncbi:hypothetical protein N9P60_00290 [bacterium]|nr:hypothetical protein [bacterium]MDB4319867.1 hypothetical protein [bacterium]